MVDNKVVETDDESITIEFPCNYPIKIVGDASADFESIVVNVIKQYAPDLDLNTLTRRDSKKGNFQSLSVMIVATGQSQLEAIFEDLKATNIVRMVL